MAKKVEGLAVVPLDANTALAALGIKPDDRRGKENIDAGDKLPKFLKVSQKVSPELEPSSPRYMEELRPNQLFLTGGAGPIYGDTVEVIPVALRKHVIQFADDKLGRKFERNLAWNDPRTAFGPDGEKPAATKIYDFAVIVIEGKGVFSTAILSMSVTNSKEAKRWIGEIDSLSGPMFAYRFRVGITLVPFEKTVYGVFAIDTKGAAVVTAEQFALSSKAYADSAAYLAKAEHIEGEIVGREPGDEDPNDM